MVTSLATRPDAGTGPARSTAWSWLALLLTPMISLANLGVVYALAVPACEGQTTLWLQCVQAASTVSCGLLSWMAWRVPRNGTLAGGSSAGSPLARQDFIAAMGRWAGLLFTLVTMAQWFVALALSPCLA